MNRAVFLDRDGVLNRSVMRDGRPVAPRSLEEFELLPGVRESVTDLRRAGFKLIVVTNQPDAAMGAQQLAAIESMHVRLRELLPIDDLRACFHVNADACACRKPKPGMILEAAAQWGIDLTQSFMVGDRSSDVAAGHAAGCKAILVDYSFGERAAADPDAVVGSLREATDVILSGGLREAPTSQGREVVR
jgi:D-glycero-D-manno-heptose 1,7-bisphosphate phosphatase